MYVYDFTGHAKEQDKRDFDFEYIKKFFNNKGGSTAHEVMTTGCVKFLGWKYVFHDELKKYVVKQYGSWHEYFAPNKTLLRKALYGRVERIVQI